MTPPLPHRTGHFELGGPCPHCGETLEPGARVVGCPACGISQHETCWDLHGGCGSYHCIPGTRFDPREVAADIVVTEEDLRGIARERLDVPAARRPAAPPPEPARPEATSRMAMWSLGLGGAAVLLAGIPGVVAAVLGGISLARIGSSRGKLGGTGYAVGGILLGILSTVGWLVAGILYLDSRKDPFSEDFPREIRLEGTPEPIAAALRRTVFVEGTRDGSGFTAGGPRWIGSGVILGIAGGRAAIVTNRHVALGEDAADGAKRPLLRVRFIGGTIGPATVRWLAPGGADLALLSCDAPPGTDPGAGLPGGRDPAVGESVFAVGNPRGLGWTFTRGVVSGFTSRRSPGGRSVEVIQTQTPIGPGSSGGGLFDEAGRLVGINTWTATGEGAEGLHFAISARAGRPPRGDGGEDPVSMRIRRLQGDLEIIGRTFPPDGRIRIRETKGSPPDRYMIEYLVTGLEQTAEGRIVRREDHLVLVTLTLAYPRQAPACRMLTPVFHPNIAPHAVCVGDHWAAGESLAHLLVRIAEILTWQSYNTKSPLNGEAARWADAHRSRLPIDPVDLTGYYEEREGGRAMAALPCSHCGGRDGVEPCSSGHPACNACRAPCPSCARAVCPACTARPCSACAAATCVACGAACANCRKVLCGAHASACTSCARPFCGDCGDRCPTCSANLCLDHLQSCAHAAT